MERFELLARLGFAPPEACRMRVIIDTDAKNEGDDDFAILHHLLTPQFDVRGICAPISRSKPPKGVCRPTAWNAVTRRYAAC